MRRENDLEVRKAVGKTSLAFIDLENMPATISTGAVIFATILFGTIGWFFYRSLFVKEADLHKLKREKLATKRSKRQD